MRQSPCDIELAEGANELNVEMTPIALPPSGEILEITWYDEENEVWRPISDPMPRMKTVTQRFRVSNTGSRATFKIGYCYWSSYQERWIWKYSPSVDIEPGEGDIDWRIWTGGAQTISVTYHLFSDDTEVDSMTVTITVV